MQANPMFNETKRFNISPADPASQTMFAGYGIYSSNTNSVRIYISSRGTSSAGIDITAAIPAEYRPKNVVMMVGTINENTAGNNIVMSTAGVVYETFSGTFTSALVFGEYTL